MPELKPRYYYDDPLEAAWMCRNYGVMFVGQTGEPVGLHKLLSFPHVSEVRHYVHPNSSYLFTLTIGDLVQYMGGSFAGHCACILDFREYPYESADSLNMELIPEMEYYGFDYLDANHELPPQDQIKGFKIIQRAGKSFFTPKQEQPNDPRA